METIRYLLSKVLLFIILLVVIIGLYFLFEKYMPGFHIGGNTSFFTDNLLPDPVDISLLSKATTADLSSNIYRGERSPDVAYVEYTGTGMRIVPATHPYGATVAGQATPQTPSTVGVYIRNLSLYSGGSLYTHIKFTGEAQTAFFKNGVFPIYITDTAGHLIAQEQAVATTAWSFPGWKRFTVTVQSTLPAQYPCRLVFHGAPGTSLSNEEESIPVTCNLK